MNSRQRVLASMSYQKTDRVSIDFSAHRSSGISAMEYPKLRRHLGLAERPVRVYDPIQQLAVVDEDVLDRFGADTIELGRAFALEDDAWADWVLPDGTPCQMPAWCLPQREDGRWVIRSDSGRVIAHMPDGAIFFEQTFFPFADGSVDLDGIPEAMAECMWTAIASPPGPLVAGPDGAKRLRQGAERLRSATDRAIVGLFGGNLLEMGHFLFRNDNFFMLLAGEPARACEFLDRVVEMHLRNLEQFLSAVGDLIDVILFGDDLGMQTGPQISPAMYREFFKPRHARLWSAAGEMADVKTNLHCCGGVRELLADLIDAGIDSINPVQINCRGMDLAGLKQEFGGRIVFWGGGCDTRDILPNATPDEVRRHVRRQLDVFGTGGGFVFQQVHNILADVPPENIIAMFQAVR